MDETETVEVEEDIEEVEDYQDNGVNPLVYVVGTLVLTAVGYVGFRFWQNRRRNNRLAVVEALPAQEDKESE